MCGSGCAAPEARHQKCSTSSAVTIVRRWMCGAEDADVRRADRGRRRKKARDICKKGSMMDRFVDGLVSVVIPAFNAEKFIMRCLASVCAQTYRELEVLVVDDGSSDGTGFLLDRIARRDGRVRVFHRENGGTSAARNFALEMACGEFLLFVDADDFMARDYVEKLVKRQCVTDADMVIGGVRYVDESGRVLKRLVPDYYMRGLHEEWTMRISAVWAHFYRRRVWEEYGVRFPVGVRGEDLPISLFFSVACRRIAVLPYAGYAYVQHEASAMQNFRGLRNYELPMEAMEAAIARALQVGTEEGPYARPYVVSGQYTVSGQYAASGAGKVAVKGSKSEAGMKSSRAEQQTSWTDNRQRPEFGEELEPRFSRAWMELFVMRIFCSFFFDLGRGAERQKLRELARKIVRIEDMYMPDVDRNPLTRVNSGVDVPLSQRVAVRLLCVLVRTRMIYVAADVISCMK